MEDLPTAIGGIAAESRFSGVVRVDGPAGMVVERAYGLAHRGLGVANSVDTRFGIASGGKALTALAVISLVDEGRLELATPAREVLGSDLPLVDDDVTVEHLLAHRSGIGDYLDEEAPGDITDYVLPVPVHALATTEQFLPVLDGHPPKFRPGERFSYCNAGYVVLALIAERASGLPFHQLVWQRVCEPAGMADTSFLRSDEPADRVALGYLAGEGLRTNVFHLPVRASGDGGVHSTAADIHALWCAFLAGRIVPARWVAEMLRPRSDVPRESKRYGLGFWLHMSGVAAMLEGYDAGASFSSVHDPTGPTTATVVSNTSEGAWPLARYLQELIAP